MSNKHRKQSQGVDTPTASAVADAQEEVQEPTEVAVAEPVVATLEMAIAATTPAPRPADRLDELAAMLPEDSPLKSLIATAQALAPELRARAATALEGIVGKVVADDAANAITKVKAAMDAELPAAIMAIAEKAYSGFSLKGREVVCRFLDAENTCMILAIGSKPVKASGNGSGGHRNGFLALLPSGVKAKYTAPDGTVTEYDSPSQMFVKLGCLNKKGVAVTTGFATTAAAFEYNGYTVDWEKRVRFGVKKAPKPAAAPTTEAPRA